MTTKVRSVLLLSDLRVKSAKTEKWNKKVLVRLFRKFSNSDPTRSGLVVLHRLSLLLCISTHCQRQGKKVVRWTSVYLFIGSVFVLSKRENFNHNRPDAAFAVLSLVLGGNRDIRWRRFAFCIRRTETWFPLRVVWLLASINSVLLLEVLNS